jgi:hypothetical protein
MPGFGIPFPCLDAVLNVPLSPHLQDVCERMFHRTTALCKYLLVLHAPGLAPEKQVEATLEASISPRVMETFPNAVQIVLKDAITQCQATPPTTWPSALLDLINREDLTLLASSQQPQIREPTPRQVSLWQRSCSRHANSFRLLLSAMSIPSAKLPKHQHC